jgi:N-acetylmuramoyl-L-alanine amidase
MIDLLNSDLSALMNTSRRHFVQQAAMTAMLPVGLLMCPVLSYAARITAVRVWPAQEYTRITLEHDNDVKFTQFLIKNPERLVVEIEGLDLNGALRELVHKITPDDPYVQSVRIGQNRPKVVRMVFDLKTEIKPQVFSLDPIGQFQHRLILDLYPTTPLDPLIALAESNRNVNTSGQNSPPASSSSSSNTGSNKWTGKLSETLGTPPEVKMDMPPAKIDSKADPKFTKSDGGLLDMDSAGLSANLIKRKPKGMIVALDPGHGGEDPGAVGPNGTQEKNIVLAIAKRLADKLADEGVQTYLTRDADFFVPLHVRVQKARRVKADLFVSIHADAFIRPEARGSSVFVLSEKGASSSAAAWLAKKENDADLIGGLNIATRDKLLASVLLDLSTTAQINDSLKLGKLILGELGQVNRLHKNEVEQASFAVLKAPDIPSILVETAFVSNPDEEEKLRDEAFQDKLANAITGGLRRYMTQYGVVRAKRG